MLTTVWPSHYISPDTKDQLTDLRRCPGLAYDTERSRMNQRCTDHIFVLSHADRRIAERCSTASNSFRSVRLDAHVIVEDHIVFQEPERRHSSNISVTHEQGSIALAVYAGAAKPGSLKRTCEQFRLWYFSPLTVRYNVFSLKNVVAFVHKVQGSNGNAGRA